MPPTELLTWVLDRGLSAGALLVCIVLGFVIRAMRADEKALHAKIEAQREAHRGDVAVLHQQRAGDLLAAADRERGSVRELTTALLENAAATRSVTTGIEELRTAVDRLVERSEDREPHGKPRR